MTPRDPALKISEPMKFWRLLELDGVGSFHLLLLFLFVLGLEESVGLLDPGHSLAFTLLHPLPSLLPLSIQLDDILLPLPLLLNLRKMPFQVVQLIRHPFQLLLRLALSISAGKHLLVVSVDQIDQLSLIGRLLVLVLRLRFVVLVPQFLQLALLSVDFCLELLLPSLVVLD